MRRALTMLVAAIAVPLFAEEPAKTTTTVTPAKPHSGTPTVISVPAPAKQPDSPLVAAARRSNRLGKKPTNVITNETLSKGSTATRVTTTSNQPELKLPAQVRPTLEMKADAKRERDRKRAEAAKAAQAAGQKPAEPEPTEATEEEGLFESEETPPEGAQSQQKPPQG